MIRSQSSHGVGDPSSRFLGRRCKPSAEASGAMASVTARARDACTRPARGARPAPRARVSRREPRPAAVAHRPAARPPRGARASFSVNLRHRVRGSAPFESPRPHAPDSGRHGGRARAHRPRGDSLELWVAAALLVCASLGAYAYKTAVGRALSRSRSARWMAAAARRHPGRQSLPGPHYAAIQTATVSLATPALLFGADLRTVLRDGLAQPSRFVLKPPRWRSTTFAAFTGLAGPMRPSTLRRRDTRERRRLEVGRRVGRQERGGGHELRGGLRHALGVSPAAFSAGVAADNVFAVLYFPLTSFLGGPPSVALERAGTDSV